MSVRYGGEATCIIGYEKNYFKEKIKNKYNIDKLIKISYINAKNSKNFNIIKTGSILAVLVPIWA